MKINKVAFVMFAILATSVVFGYMMNKKECIMEGFQKGDDINGSVVYLAQTNGEIQKDIHDNKLARIGDGWAYSNDTENGGGYKTVASMYSSVIDEATSKGYSLDTTWEVIAANVSPSDS